MASAERADERERRLIPLRVLTAWLALVTAGVVAAGHLLGLAELPGGSTSLDRTITAWVVAHRTGTLTTLAHGLSLVGSQWVLAPLVAVVLGALGARRRWTAAARLFAAWAGATVAYNVGKLFVARPRPPTELWLSHVGSTSFPSGHATQSAATLGALAIVIAASSPRARLPARALALILAAAVGWSRVYLGVHWSTDVIAGWLAGAAWLAAVAHVTSATGRPSSR